MEKLSWEQAEEEVYKQEILKLHRNRFAYCWTRKRFDFRIEGNIVRRKDFRVESRNLPNDCTV